MYRPTALLTALLLTAVVDIGHAATPVVCPAQWGPANVMVQQEPVPAPPGWTSPGKWSGGGQITQKLTYVVWQKPNSGNGIVQCYYGRLVNPQKPSSLGGFFAYNASLPSTCDPAPGSTWRVSAKLADSKGQVTGQQLMCSNGSDLNALIDPAVCTITCR